MTNVKIKNILSEIDSAKALISSALSATNACPFDSGNVQAMIEEEDHHINNLYQKLEELGWVAS